MDSDWAFYGVFNIAVDVGENGTDLVVFIGVTASTAHVHRHSDAQRLLRQLICGVAGNDESAGGDAPALHH